jgi:hypothetical protein
MEFTGRCYCGDITYKASGDPAIRVQCHCRECQYLSGGSVNTTIGMPEASFEYTKGAPAKYKRADLENGVTRHFCGNCGTQVLTMAPGLAGVMLIKVGTMDDPSMFTPDLAIFTAESQAFHHIADGLPNYAGFPG